MYYVIRKNKYSDETIILKNVLKRKAGDNAYGFVMAHDAYAFAEKQIHETGKSTVDAFEFIIAKADSIFTPSLNISIERKECK